MAHDDESLTAELRRTLSEYWGYDDFRALQREAMTAVMRDRDSLIVLPTGGGKSLCYQAPAMCREGMTVVISPLISLMKDQVDALRENGIPAAFINSTLTRDEKWEVADAIKAHELKLLYVAPERLSLQGLIDLLKQTRVAFIAIDEAHCVSHWGHDFRPHYRQLSILRDEFPGVGIHCYTATATEVVRRDIVEQLRLHEPEMLVGSFDRPNLFYRVERRGAGALDAVVDVITRHRGESGIVYCISRKDVDELTAQLRDAGYNAAAYHAGMEDADRKQNQEWFITDRVTVIVATVAFGMGIDKSDVRFVVHCGVPKSVEHYQQESGRAGRDGLPAECCVLWTNRDFQMWEFICKDQPAEVFDASMRSLRGVRDYIDGVICRHRALTRHFGEELDSDCETACDLCEGGFDAVPEPLLLGQKILSSVHRQGQRFGAEYTALVLKGSNETRILNNGHNSLSTYGLLHYEDKGAILTWIGQLVNQGFLKRVGEYNILEITAFGKKLLKGELTPRLLKPETARKRSKKTYDAESWEGVDRGLFDVLREIRTEIATDRGVPPYVVFSDASLRDMARRRPTNDESLLHVHGVGEKKRKDYGERFVGAILDYCEDNDIESDVAAATVLKKPTKTKANAKASFPFFKEGRTVEEVAEKLGRAVSTAHGYFLNYLEIHKITQPPNWIDGELAREIESAAEKNGYPTGLRPLFDHFDGEVDWNTLRIVMTCLRNRIDLADEAE